MQNIYEEIMLGHYFNRMKYLRNSWNSKEDTSTFGVASLIDIGGEDHRQYEYIMQGCSDIIFEMLAQVIKELIKKHEIPVKYYDLRSSGSEAYFVGDKRHWIGRIDHHKGKQILAFSRTDKQQKVLFIFKKFGGHYRVPESTLVELMKAAKLERYCYISYVENDAFSEIINHNKNPSDPTRGTGIFSFKQFIEAFFGKEEYAEFRRFANLFSEKVKEYFGFALVRTLKPNAIHNFKKIVRDDLKMINPSEIGASTGICESQRKIIEKHFYEDKNYEILLGSSDFAQSYMTAEWLYTSLKDAGNIDLTAIAMGYFKAIEQLLFAFLKNHTREMDGFTRVVYVGKDKTYADQRGNAQLTDSLVTDPEKSKDLSLGSLTGFFGYHDIRKNQYYKRNQDLLVPGITDATYEFIIDVLGKIVGLRNGYFHKDNLKGDNPDDRKKTEEARKSARLVFYILLGAFTITEEDRTRLGLIKVEGHDDFYRLCDYVNNKAYGSYMLRIPIVYIDDTSDPYAFGFFHQDDFIQYDNYGEPVYSGAYFKEFGKDGRIIKIGRDNIPKEVWEGVFVTSDSFPVKAEPSGAKKRIFYNGKFVAEEVD